MTDICGVETTKGEPCQNPAESCPWHDSDNDVDTGRPTKLTKQREEGIASMIEEGHSQASAARAHGVDPTTLTRWINKGKEQGEGIFADFYKRIARARAYSEQQYVKELRHMADEVNDTNTLRWMLQQRFPESWGESDALGGESEEWNVSSEVVEVVSSTTELE